MKAALLTKKLRARVLATLLAGAVGAFVMTPAAYALPTNPTYDGAVSIVKSTNNLDMNISSNETNNVIKWEDFSIARGETVAFDAKNYLNQVTGSNMSEIWGTLKGGGTIYLINPNGILFGAGSQVNVGALYASTRTLSNADIENFKAGNAISVLADAPLTGNIINMGDLTATKNITLEGNNLIFAGTDSGISNLPAYATDSTVNLVVAKNGAVKVGTLSGDDTNGYVIKETQHQTDAMDKTCSFQLVRNKEELQNISNNINGNYLLAGDIDASGGEFEPIGIEFNGQFNGMYYKIKELTINKPNDAFVGLFRIIGTSGTVKNVGLTGGQITGNGYVGSIAGQSSGTISNVYNTGSVWGGSGSVGGIVGNNSGAIELAYNTGNVKGHSGIGGIAGGNESGGTISKVYNKGTLRGLDPYGEIVGNNSGTISEAYKSSDDMSQVEWWDTSGATPTLKSFVAPVEPVTLWEGKALLPQTAATDPVEPPSPPSSTPSSSSTPTSSPTTTIVPTPTPAPEPVPATPPQVQPTPAPVNPPAPATVPAPAAPAVAEAPALQPITQTATTTLGQVLQSAGKGEIKEVANVTMKSLTEAENSTLPNVQTTASPVEQQTMAPQTPAASGGNIRQSFAGGGMLTMVDKGVSTPASMSAGEVAAQQSKTAPPATLTEVEVQAENVAMAEVQGSSESTQKSDSENEEDAQ